MGNLAHELVRMKVIGTVRVSREQREELHSAVVYYIYIYQTRNHQGLDCVLLRTIFGGGASFSIGILLSSS